MEIPINVDVHCKDGVAGHTAAIVMAPATRQVTHIVVKGKGSLIGEFLVPIEVVDKSTAHTITLVWSLAELAAAARFDQAVFVGEGATPGTGMIWPYAATDDMNFGSPQPAAFVVVEQVPDNGVAVHVGAHVDATDGRVGTVDQFIIDRSTSVITHIVLRHGHLWGKREISVPVRDIDHVQDDIVYLKLDKAAIEDLPDQPKD